MCPPPGPPRRPPRPRPLPAQVYLTPSTIHLVMDYASGGSLLDYVQRRRRLREPLARWFFQQLVIGVDYCHKKARPLP